MTDDDAGGGGGGREVVQRSSCEVKNGDFWRTSFVNDPLQRSRGWSTMSTPVNSRGRCFQENIL